ncbi:MAG: cysteine dioxygenase family protein [Planctomycetota bacterium]|jgi:predicted metal-dependent enzyme (double-stranded beta helix superfamily)
MTSNVDPEPGIARLIQRLDRDTTLPGTEEICAAVKNTLCEEIVDGRLQLPPAATEPGAEDYARRLLHRSPDGRYTVVAMIWGSGQGTPIHDHGGKWCVECVYQGRVRISSYDLLGDADAAVVGLRKTGEIDSGKGAAGSLIPPFDYHVIENTEPATAVTVHVYGGEMDACHVFHRDESPDHYRREWRKLSYTP